MYFRSMQNLSAANLFPEFNYQLSFEMKKVCFLTIDLIDQGDTTMKMQEKQKSFIVVSHPDKMVANDVANEIIQYINDLGHRVVAEDAQADIAIILGGDGYMMHSIDRFAPRGIACFGINAGDVGFITHGTIDNWQKSVDLLIAGDYVIEKRMMFEILWHGKYYGPFSNDVFLRHPTSVAKIAIVINGESVYAVNADGVVIATPMGSTAYNASAGGSIIQPGVHAFGIAPIAPLELNARPLVVNPQSEVTLRVVRSKNDASLAVVADGAHLCDIVPGEELVVRKAEIASQIIVTDGHGFFHALQTKKGLKK